MDHLAAKNGQAILGIFARYWATTVLLAEACVSRSSSRIRITIGPENPTPTIAQLLRGGRGDLVTHGIQRQKTAFLDFVIIDTDVPSYQPSTEGPRENEKAAKRKKDEYLEACQECRRDFIPMAYSVDGLAGKEARAVEKRLASLLASKRDRPYIEMECFVKTWMSVSIVRSISMLLRGCRSLTWKRGPPKMVLS